MKNGIPTAGRMEGPESKDTLAVTAGTKRRDTKIQLQSRIDRVEANGTASILFEALDGVGKS